MSKRNSQQAKTAARERLRVERERQAKRDKAKKNAIVASSIVGVLAIAGVASYFVVQGNKPSYWEAAKNDALVAPKNTTGKNHTTVTIGKDSADKTISAFEDPRCPVCASFEQTVGSTVQKDLDDGKYKIQYIGATFLDTNLQGEGSKNALSALGAALNVSKDAFWQYKEAMYSKKWHPEETDDKFKDDAYLLKIANTIPALKSDKTFQKDVKDGTFDKWAIEMSKNFDNNKFGVQGTPSFVYNGKKITGSDGDNAPMTVAEWNTAVDKALKG
ncbi:thioredoxin domain-containing protein [Streptomyces sp. VRA16 Mangrove soil]|uniref:thioredoxin domain-containing protein n=1 Tax=Streptomyces sp. VRA16 Mangrove soil TaxID=2817434 RepID=UPI001A9D6E71|nr:thioredoxin domain-containing protein [Streptomyces sp. VRA16 Mangrove soil]MBO1333434.1 DsbA family protein [Streptomyces sp. VRA16 Mangrove soil]